MASVYISKASVSSGRSFGQKLKGFFTGLNLAIGDTMVNDIAPKLIERIQQEAEATVYDYRPRYYRRREKNPGGLISPDTMSVDYNRLSQTLTISLNAEWQNKGFRYVDGSGTGGNKLADVVQQNWIYNAPPRSFVEAAETSYAAEEFAADLEAGLHARYF